MPRRRKRSRLEFNYKENPIGDLRKRFAMLSEEAIKHTLVNTSQYYTKIEDENREIQGILVQAPERQSGNRLYLLL